MVRRKRLYVPITRSGCSIIASILTQLIMNSHSNPKPKKSGEGEEEPEEWVQVVMVSLHIALWVFCCRLIYLLLTRD